MAVHEDTKSDNPQPSADLSESTVAASHSLAPPDGQSSAKPEESGEPQDDEVASPTQLGTKRFVYAGYFGGAIGMAFVVSKLFDFAWLKFQSYKPSIGDPREDIVMPLAGLVGLGVALYCWYRTRARELAEQVAAEMARVTWPGRTEVTNGTFVVIVTTVISTVFFALMDKFWGFVTNLVYGGT
jgi:preprotein translocase SecE subunit